MIVVLFLVAFLIAVSLKISKDNSACALSKEQTQTIKGMFVITIFFSHFCSYVVFDNWFDMPMKTYCSWLGQLMVVPFLFYSGYGVFESVKKKGMDYISTFPKKRIIKTLIHFDLAVLLFLAFDFFFAPEYLSLTKILLSLVAWSSIGNSNWFIFAILCAYAFSYLSLHFAKGNLVKGFILITVLCFVYIAVVSRFRGSYWYDTILSFPLGGLLSLYKEKIMLWSRKWGLWISLTLLSLLLLILAKTTTFPIPLANSQIAMLGLVLLMVFVSMKVKINSKILTWFGAQVFGIYILQRLPMNFGQYMQWNDQNIYLYFLFCFFVTVLLAVGFNKVTDWIDSKLF